MGRSAASPSAATSTTSFDNTTASPMPYANSPRSSTNMMNTSSPQQQTPQQQQQSQTQQQQRQKLMQLPQHQQQQLLAQQQFRQSAMQGMGQVKLASHVLICYFPHLSVGLRNWIAAHYMHFLILLIEIQIILRFYPVLWIFLFLYFYQYVTF